MTGLAQEPSRRRLIAIFCCWWLLAALRQLCPDLPHERTFHASKAEVQKALHDIPSYPGGKLPVLEGFADAMAHALDNYKRGYYKYDVQLKSMSPARNCRAR